MQLNCYLCVLFFIILTSSLVLIEHHSVYIMPFNQPSRSTRGMSYDIRCIPKIKKKHSVWLNPHIDPNQYGKCFELK